MEPRVSLLSNLAREFLVKPPSRKESTGFWSGLSSFFKKQKAAFQARPSPLETVFEKSLGDEGYIPFCKIGDVRMHVKEEGQTRYLVVTEPGQSWDLSEWGTGDEFKARLVAEAYFMVTKDDFQIDEAETEVLRAIFAYFEITPEEIANAKEMVYWTLVESTMEDGVITDEEQETMARIMTALELTEADRLELHRRAIEDRFSELFDRPEGEPPATAEEIEAIAQMARRLGLEEEFITFKVEGARKRLTPA